MELKKENLRNVAGGHASAIIFDDFELPLKKIARVSLINKTNDARLTDATAVSRIRIKDATGKEILALRDSDIINVTAGRQAQIPVATAQFSMVFILKDAKELKYSFSGSIVRELLERRVLENVLDDATLNEFKASLRCAGNGGNFVPGQ